MNDKLAQQLETLSPQQRHLFELMMAEKRTARSNRREGATIPKRQVDVAPPLSFSQRRLWFLDQLEPNSAFHISVAARLRGTLDKAILRAAIDEVVRRHESLRTTFAKSDGEPVQVIHEQLEPSFENHDLSAVPGSEREAAMLERLMAAREPGFDLAAGPLLRIVLVDLDADEFALMLAMHHIVSDGWSNGLLLKEIALLYDAFCRDLPSPLPALRIQYPDFATWQRERLRGETLTGQLDYWKKQLVPPAAFLQLPADRPRPHQLSFRGASLDFRIEAATVTRLAALWRAEDATPFMLFLAAFKVLLARYSGQGDIVVGSPIANRNHPEIEPLIGFFVNTLTLRSKLAAGKGFRLFLREIRDLALGAFQHQDLPFEKLVEELQPDRDLSRPPFFQVMFVLQNAPIPSFHFPNLTIDWLSLPDTSAQLDLTLSLTAKDDHYEGLLNYNTDLFDEARMRRLAGHYLELLESIANAPDRTIDRIGLLPETEALALLSPKPCIPHHPLDERLLHQIIEEQVGRTPQEIAIEIEDLTATYAAMNGSANRLARHLRALGLGPGRIAAIFMRPCLEMPIAILAVLKAGGAFLPLDPDQPRARLNLMLNDSGAILLLTTVARGQDLGEVTLPILELDRGQSRWSELANDNLDPISGPDDPAYLIYTSGSTGKPKGVLVQHKGVAQMGHAFIEAHGFQPGERQLWVPPIFFDAAMGCLLPPLSCGMTVVMHPDPVALDHRALTVYCNRHGITRLTAPTPLFHHWIDGFLADGEPNPLPSVRSMQAGGDAVSKAKLGSWSKLTGGTKTFFNHYGPTEVSICVTIYPTLDGAECDGEIPIGRPMPWAPAFILDRVGQPVPLGIPGELFLGGPGVALGYLNRPGLTAERFLPDPFSAMPGARMYRTGDLARFLDDGQGAAGPIEFLGRLDYQVKIRGYRIETGEIEIRLKQHPAIADAVVLARADVHGQKSLAAYLKLVAGAASAAENSGSADFELGMDLRRHLKRHLPDYMVPPVMVVVDAIPLLASGKVDRQALPDPDGARLLGQRLYLAPRTPIESRLAELFGDLLKRELVGAHDHFFELGGHSLLATQLVARINDEFGITLALKTLFEYPTIDRLALQVTQSMDSGGLVARPDTPRIARAPRDQPLPLSFSQLRLWFLDQLFPEAESSLNTYAALRLSGPLETAPIRLALAAIMGRHETWRTSFTEINGEPRQIITPHLPLPFGLADLSGLPATRREFETDRILTTEASRKFDLSQAPLVRTLLVRLDRDEHLLFVNMHHIISDGWSVGILSREFVALHESIRTGTFGADQPSPLPALPIQYADFANWQRQRMTGETLAEYLEFWRDKLTGRPPLDMPRDRRQGTGAIFQRLSVPIRFGAELTATLNAIAQRRGASLYMVLLAGFQTLLFRYTRQTDISIATLNANRNYAQIQDLMGFFLNTIVFRDDLGAIDKDSPEKPATTALMPSFHRLIDRARETTLAALARQDLPYETLLDELQPRRELFSTTLFEAMLVLQNMPIQEVTLPGLRVAPYHLQAKFGAFSPAEMTLILNEEETGLSGELEYDPDLYDTATATTIAHHFSGLLAQLAQFPDRAIDRVSFLSDTEREWLIGKLNETSTPFAEDSDLLAVFEARVRQQPDSVALEQDGQRWTYAELNRRANRLAHHLSALGAGPETFVGIAMNRSPDLIAALLAVLKAGAAYLPLDPTTPADRLEYMMADAGIAVLISREPEVADLPQPDAPIVIVNGADQRALAAQPDFDPRPVSNPHNLAYAIYTSGSTGRPKGVGIARRSLTHYAQTARARFAIGSGSKVLQFASIGFDTAAEEIFPCLLAGGRLVLRTESMLDSVARFLAESERYGLTHWDLPTAYWHAMTAEIEDGAHLLPPSLELVIIGGERAVPARLAVWRERAASGIRLVNTYGPTEMTIVATTCDLIGENAPSSADRAPIGRPIANTRAYILDPYVEPQPAGLPGALFLAGLGVARGYLGRPALTAAAFVPDPFATSPGERMYRTGDLVRHLGDGEIEFLGRVDHQVKVRGYRIEPGEIEAALLSLAGLREAAVIACRAPSGEDLQLIAFLVAEPGETLDPAQVRDGLSEHLPKYMVPTGFHLLDALPLTKSGKLDRARLVNLALEDSGEIESRHEFVAPETEVEQQVAAIWSEVLGVARVSAHENFFDIGGNSLLATQIVYRLNKIFGVELSIRLMFGDATVETLSLAIEELIFDQIMGEDNENEGGEDTEPTRNAALELIEPRLESGPAPLSFAQHRLWFLDQLAPGNPAYNIPHTVRLRGELDRAALQRGLNEIVRRHAALRTTFCEQGREPVQIIHPVQPVEMAIIDLSGVILADRHSQALALADEHARAPFNLRSGPLFRATLLEVGAGDYMLLLNMHHIISDAWSMTVFVREIFTLYMAFTNGQPSPLPDLEIQYADFAAWQRTWFSGERMQRQLDFWTGQLRGVAPLVLPTDRPRPAMQTFPGAMLGFDLGQSLSTSVLALGRAQDATPFMTLQAVFLILLARYSGQEDIVIGTPIANRNRQQIEPLIGFFVNTLALRADLSGNPTFTEFLARVRNSDLEAYGHQDLPFEQIVDTLQLKRDLSRTPIFQVFFTIQNSPAAMRDLTGIALESLPSATHTAKFDLSLYMNEIEGKLIGAFEYNIDLFDQATIYRMAEHFERLLMQITKRPESRLAALTLLDEAEAQMILTDWNATGREHPKLDGIYAAFADRAAKMPEAVALIHADAASGADTCMTYRDLETRATSIAAALHEVGAGPETTVAVCLERSPDLVAALLAVLRLGAAYLPLDPNYPPERIAFMLEDSGTRLAVTEARWLPLLDPAGVTPLILEDLAASDGQGSAVPIAAVTSQSAAYIIYTSGSTGRPKGIVGLTGATLNRIQWMWREFPFASDEIACQRTSLNFVDSIWEIFGPLLAGIPNVILPTDLVQDLPRLVATLATHRVTRLLLVPSLLRPLLETFPDLFTRLPHLTHWTTSGEALEPALAEHFQRLNRETTSSALTLLNLYGSSEVAADVTAHRVMAEPQKLAGMPIGKPIDNVRVFLMDRNLALAAPGMPGEIFAGGAGLARGYLNQPAMTAERFIPNPFTQGSAQGGSRLFRTGDLGRYLGDGSILFLGRRDTQVKLRGFRIELGEIETALASHQGVREAVVLLTGRDGSDPRLVAFLTGDRGLLEAQPPAAYLRAKLPDHAVPASFIILDALPHLPNAKIDRPSLALLAAQGQEGDTLPAARYLAPRTVVEQSLAQIYADVLKLEQVGAWDHFFDLGGHSLLATQLMTRVNEAFATDLGLKTLFEHPTIEGLAAEVEAARQRGSGHVKPLTIPVVPRDRPIPLSFSQFRLWILDRLFPEAESSLNVQAGLRFKGEVSPRTLLRCLQTLSDRHETWRTHFAEIDGEPRQLVTTATRVPFGFSDLSGLPENLREAEARRALETEAQRKFDLTRGPLVRAILVRVGPTDHILFVNMHHIISDGWSVGVMSREFNSIYHALSAGKPVTLPPLPIQYADFSAWQRQYLTGETRVNYLDFWRDKLVDRPPLALPFDRAKRADMPFLRRSEVFELPQPLTAPLVALARSESASLYMVLLAAVQVLLFRYTRQKDISIGTLNANRNHTQIQDLIGFFVNTLVFRGNLGPEADTGTAAWPSFRQLIARARETTLSAFAHQDIPYETLLDELQPRRDILATTLFEVMLVLQNLSVGEVKMSGLAVEGFSLERFGAFSPADLTMIFYEAESGMTGEFEYNSELFDRKTMHAMIEHLLTLIERVGAEPDCPIDRLRLMTRADHSAWVTAYNQTAVEAALDRDPITLFEAQVAATPDAIAVSQDGNAWSYAELNRRANQIAHHLRGLGVAPDQFVGIAMKRSPDQIAAILAIQKAGAAYLPLDPDYPAERLGYMIADAGIAVLLGREPEIAAFPETAAQQVIINGADKAAIQTQPTHNPSAASLPEHLAYAIYTSGSTGVPKGVAITRASLAQYALTASSRFGLSATDHVLQFASISFDTAAEEIFPCLLAGARLVLRTEAMLDSIAAFLRTIAREGISVLDLPTAYWHAIVSELEAEPQALPESLRLVIIGGERAAPARLEAWRRGAPGDLTLLNTYGPTETTIVATTCDLAGPGAETSIIASDKAPIGKPLSNTQVYVVDAHGEPNPPGMPGELLIGGAGLARGYLGRPGITAERFVPDPFSHTPGSRLYRSGDLVRFLPDGNLDFIGRVDHQVKVRGYRIELGEIEAVLAALPTIDQATVIAHRPSPAIDPVLVAFLVAAKDEAEDSAGVREALRTALPAHAVPAHLVFIEAMPLTASRKIDRNALARRAETIEDALPATAYAPPETPIEERLVEIWCEVLGLERLGIHDNFFDIGGNSLLATQIVYRINKNFGIEFSIRHMFEDANVENIALQIEEILLAEIEAETAG